MTTEEVRESTAKRPASSRRRRRVRRGLRPLSLVTLVAAGLLPFLGFMNANLESSLDARKVAAYAVVVVVVLIGVAALLLFATRTANPHAIVFGTATFATLFFAYPTWLSAFELLGFDLVGAATARLAVWLFVAGAVTKLVSDLSRRPLFRQWMAGTLVLVCTISMVGIALGASDDGGQRVAGADVRPPASPDDLVRSPNVYLFLLDAYARNDVIAEQTGFDNSAFHAALDDRGFVTTERALSSFPATILSTMALFESGYPASKTGDLTGGTKALERFIRGDNATVERFHQLGYTFIHSHAGPFVFARCSTRFADTCIEANGAQGGVGEFEVVLLDLTPVPLLRPVQAPRTTPGFVVDELEQLAPQEPFFLFAHILTPHHPYIYDESCNLRARPVLKPMLELAQEREHYAREVACLNADMTAAIDRIIDRDPEAVILVLSDHGSELITDLNADVEDWTDTQLAERLPVQNNLRLPEECQENIADDTHLVANFEIVFACLEGREPDLPEYRAFVWKQHTTNIIELPPERWLPLADVRARTGDG